MKLLAGYKDCSSFLAVSSKVAGLVAHFIQWIKSQDISATCQNDNLIQNRDCYFELAAKLTVQNGSKEGEGRATS